MKRGMTPSELWRAVNDLEKKYPNETVRRDYDGAGQLIVEPAVEEPLWPTCDQVLADWFGCEVEDVSEWGFEQNIKAAGA